MVVDHGSSKMITLGLALHKSDSRHKGGDKMADYNQEKQRVSTSNLRVMSYHGRLTECCGLEAVAGSPEHERFQRFLHQLAVDVVDEMEPLNVGRVGLIITKRGISAKVSNSHAGYPLKVHWSFEITTPAYDRDNRRNWEVVSFVATQAYEVSQLQGTQEAHTGQIYFKLTILPFERDRPAFRSKESLESKRQYTRATLRALQSIYGSYTKAVAEYYPEWCTKYLDNLQITPCRDENAH